ncbi:hypothetical protein [Pseudomonas hunanensis]|uniref:hypothetical protein n=1 Tax=Pseudomonas hunanensis TaxID=1247546 RepID=UPI0030D7F371
MASASASISGSDGLPQSMPLVVIESSASLTEFEKSKSSTATFPESVQPIVKFSSGKSDTNQRKQVVVSPDKERFKKGFHDCLMSDHSEYGVKSMAEIYVESWMNRGGIQVQLWLSEIYLENQTNPDALMALLKVVMHVDPIDFTPTNRMIATSSLSHESLEIRECAVRCYEYWERPEFYVDLATRPLEPEWLQEYKNSFIS